MARQVWDSPCAALSNSSASDSGISEPIEKTPIPLLVRGSATLSAAGNEQRALDACHARLRRAVEVRVQDRNPKPAGAQRAREMQRQGALADAALAGAHGHEMAHAGEPVGDAGALLGNLLEDSGSSVADDVVVALHRLCVAYTQGAPGRGSQTRRPRQAFLLYGSASADGP